MVLFCPVAWPSPRLLFRAVISYVSHHLTLGTSPCKGCVDSSHILPDSERELNCLDASAFARLYPNVRQQLLGRAVICSSTHMLRPLGGSKFSPQLTLFVTCQDTYKNAGSDPYRYTSGRWLRRDSLKQKSRLTHFDLDALYHRVVALCPGASFITSHDKMEDGFNRVFIFHTDNAKRIVARLPFAFSGPLRSTTSSEVATIK
jgi:hypothetical protein